MSVSTTQVIVEGELSLLNWGTHIREFASSASMRISRLLACKRFNSSDQTFAKE